MLAWDRKFLAKLEGLGILILLYKRYVDDVTVVGPVLNPGWSYNAEMDRMQWRNELAGSNNVPQDQKTMVVLAAVANSIDRNIQFTWDVPSLNDDGKLPILDVKVWVDQGAVRHTFYKKQCSYIITIHQRSAISAREKQNTLF